MYYSANGHVDKISDWKMNTIFMERADVFTPLAIFFALCSVTFLAKCFLHALSEAHRAVASAQGRIIGECGSLELWMAVVLLSHHCKTT